MVVVCVPASEPEVSVVVAVDVVVVPVSVPVAPVVVLVEVSVVVVEPPHAVNDATRAKLAAARASVCNLAIIELDILLFHFIR